MVSFDISAAVLAGQFVLYLLHPFVEFPAVMSVIGIPATVLVSICATLSVGIHNILSVFCHIAVSVGAMASQRETSHVMLGTRVSVCACLCVAGVCAFCVRACEA